jgi:hypothetical protein
MHSLHCSILEWIQLFWFDEELNALNAGMFDAKAQACIFSALNFQKQSHSDGKSKASVGSRGVSWVADVFKTELWA